MPVAKSGSDNAVELPRLGYTGQIVLPCPRVGLSPLKNVASWCMSKNWDSLGRGGGFSLGKQLRVAAITDRLPHLKSFVFLPIVFRVSWLYFAWIQVSSCSTLWLVCSPFSHGSSTPFYPFLIHTGLVEVPGTPCSLPCHQTCLILCSSPGNSYLSMIQLFVFLLSQIFFDLYQSG